MLTPADIDNVQFRATRFTGGYDRDEVDDFLDRVVDYVKDLERKLHEERQRLTRATSDLIKARQELVEYSDLPTQQIPMQAARILEAAQKTADDVLAEANVQKNEIVGAAREDAAAAISEAQGRAYAITNEAQSKVNDAQAKLDSLRAQQRDLRRYLVDHLSSLTEGMSDAN